MYAAQANDEVTPYRAWIRATESLFSAVTEAWSTMPRRCPLDVGRFAHPGSSPNGKGLPPPFTPRAASRPTLDHGQGLGYSTGR